MTLYKFVDAGAIRVANGDICVAEYDAVALYRLYFGTLHDIRAVHPQKIVGEHLFERFQAQQRYKRVLLSFDVELDIIFETLDVENLSDENLFQLIVALYIYSLAELN